MRIDTTYLTITRSMRGASEYIRQGRREKEQAKRRHARRFFPWLLLCFAVLVLAIIQHFL